MQEPFDGETFTYSLFLVLCNRIVTVIVALTCLIVRGQGSSVREQQGTHAWRWQSCQPWENEGRSMHASQAASGAQPWQRSGT